MEYLIFGAFVLLQTADIVTTMIILNRGGYERNLLVKRVMDAMGDLQALVFLKLVVGVPILLTYCYVPATRFTLMVTIGLVDLFYCWIIFGNVNVMRELK